MYKRTEYLRHLHDDDWQDGIEEERENIRHENTTALSYSIMWFGLSSVVFALVANLFGTETASNFSGFLTYIEALFLLSIVLLLTASMLFWHGCSTGHNFKQYAELNENGDSLVMVGSLILILGLSFLCSFYLLSRPIQCVWLALYSPVGAVVIIFILLNAISVKTEDKAIVTHYIIEAARSPFYRYSQRTENGLIDILEDKKMTKGLIILIVLFGTLMMIPLFLV